MKEVYDYLLNQKNWEIFPGAVEIIEKYEEKLYKMSSFIEVTDPYDHFKFTINPDWVKAILPPLKEGGHTRIILGDGRQMSDVDRGVPPEMFEVEESYDYVRSQIRHGAIS